MILISMLEIGVISLIVLFLGFVIFLETRKKKKGKACCGSDSCASSCQKCEIQTYMKDRKKGE